MEKVDTVLITKINDIIEEATKAGQHKLAKSLGYLQIQIIEERTNAWVRGYEQGYKLAIQEAKLRKFVDNHRVEK